MYLSISGIISTAFLLPTVNFLCFAFRWAVKQTHALKVLHPENRNLTLIILFNHDSVIRTSRIRFLLGSDFSMKRLVDN